MRKIRKIRRFVRNNLKWFFVGIVYLSACWAMYQDMKNTVPLLYIVVSCVIGLGIGLVIIIKIIVPIFRYLDERSEDWLKKKAGLR